MIYFSDIIHHTFKSKFLIVFPLDIDEVHASKKMRDIYRNPFIRVLAFIHCLT